MDKPRACSYKRVSHLSHLRKRRLRSWCEKFSASERPKIRIIDIIVIKHGPAGTSTTLQEPSITTMENPSTTQNIYIQLDFLTTHEEEELMTGIDGLPWDLSQSGRRKQNFGPKCNFQEE
ncbi:hypothetical protein Zmor_016810 [Zophobas morio]|uniref:Uncharacterized protein n=1 Tax=Zophobas morio TaxID=2755281 RepID=A0AA38I432_9CUCU|nr:hypothetical protein Zmor_016810 [Zophobas morio]